MKNGIEKNRGQKTITMAGADTLIERLRKMRALSCSPSDVGMDSYVDWLSRYGNAYFLITNTIK